MGIHLNESAQVFAKGLEQLKKFVSQVNITQEVEVEWVEAARLKVECHLPNAVISAKNGAEFFRGIGHLAEKISQGQQQFSVSEAPCFETLGASFDLSRNSVLKVSTLKRLACQMALMGFHELYLYTEDTYELPRYPLFGYLRGRYTKEELQELDSFAAALGVEVIPCIQTLAHLERFLHWEPNAFLRDTPDVLLAESEETYRLIEAMFRQWRECCHTKKIHVGMDEAMGLGLGQYLKKHGARNSFEIMTTHVKKVTELAQKYGFEPMMWSDMYFRCASPTNDYYEQEIEIPQWVVESAPKEMGLVYWDYYHTEQAFYDRYISLHKQFAAPLTFAGGMWTWIGPAIDYDEFFKKSIPALDSCKKNNVSHVMITTWGDDGAEVSVRTMLLGLQTYAEFCYTGGFDRQTVFDRLQGCTGAQAQPLCDIAQFNKTPKLSPESDLPNGAKFLLYQDPLLGIYDGDIEGMGFAEQYAMLEQKFAQYESRADEEWKAVYGFYRCLAQLLKHKAELGSEMYHAYQKGDKEQLGRLSHQAAQGAKSAQELLECWRVLWFADCKPFGFEVLELRLAGVASRLASAAKRVEEYCSGKIMQIEELEQKRLTLLRDCEKNTLHGVYFWKEIASASKAF